MRKLFRVLLTAALLLVLMSAALAAEQPVTVEELGMTFSVPEGWYVLDETSAQDPAFLAKAGLTAEYVSSFLEEGATLCLLLPDRPYDIALLVEDEPIDYDLNLLGDAGINDYLRTLRQELSGNYTIKNSKIQTFGDTKWVRMELHSSYDGFYLMQQYFTTLRHGKTIMFLATIISEEEPKDTIDELEALISGIHFDRPPMTMEDFPETVAPQQDVKLTDRITLDLPKNWNIVEEAGFLVLQHAAFASGRILVLQADMWEHIQEKYLPATRAELNTAFFHDGEIAAFLTDNCQEVGKVSLGGRSYVQVEFWNDAGALCSGLAMVEDGYLYAYSALGDTTCEAYRQMVQMMESAEYPSQPYQPQPAKKPAPSKPAAETKPAASEPTASEPAPEKPDSFGMKLVKSFGNGAAKGAVAFLVCALFGLGKGLKSRKKKTCPLCGKKLSKQDATCPDCGYKPTDQDQA